MNFNIVNFFKTKASTRALFVPIDRKIRELKDVVLAFSRGCLSAAPAASAAVDGGASAGLGDGGASAEASDGGASAGLGDGGAAIDGASPDPPPARKTVVIDVSSLFHAGRFSRSLLVSMAAAVKVGTSTTAMCHRVFCGLEGILTRFYRENCAHVNSNIDYVFINEREAYGFV